MLDMPHCARTVDTRVKGKYSQKKKTKTYINYINSVIKSDSNGNGAGNAVDNALNEHAFKPHPAPAPAPTRGQGVTANIQ